MNSCVCLKTETSQMLVNTALRHIAWLRRSVGVAGRDQDFRWPSGRERLLPPGHAGRRRASGS